MDKTRVRTAADLEKKYNFAQMLELNKNVENTQQQLIKVENELNNMLNSLVINLGDLLDSQSSISLWFYDETPTYLNEPYISWNEPTEHYGDFYYDRSTGYVYKYTSNGWEQQDDTNLINAMALTNIELDIEQDHERKVFFDTPEPAYQSGDWWILEDGTLMICQIGKPSGEYEENDFVVSNRYVETVATKIDGTLKIQKGQILIISEEQDRVSRTVTDQNNRISVVEQTVNTINSKISDVVDVTKSAEDTDAQVELENINASNPIVIKIHPILESISYDYPHNDYPQNDYSKVRTLKFYNTTTNESFYWELPTDLWWYDADNYDEIQLDYGDGTSPTVIVTRKCKINADGSISLLQTPTTETYDYPIDELSLTDGDYVVTLLGYTNAYLFVRLMASNIYTTMYVTKVELNTSISQTRSYVDISAAAKVGKNEIINRINVSTEGIKIDASKINILGVLTAINNDTTTTINGNKITTGTITAAQVSSDIITTTNFSAQNINADNITGGYLSVDRIIANSITSSKIAYNTITNSQIADNTISTEKINNINADKITAGTINADNVSIINLNADNIKSGTITTASINLGNGKFRVTTGGSLTATSGEIGGWHISNNGYLYNGGTGGQNGARLYNDGRLYMKNNYGWINTGSGGTILNGNGSSYPVCISDNLSSQPNTTGGSTIGIRASFGNIRIATTTSGSYGIRFETGSGGIILNGSTIHSGSSKKMKTKIKKIGSNMLDEIYKEYTNMPLYTYDYKKKYYNGEKDQFGFILEDIENTILSRVIHITENESNFKSFNTSDLPKLNMIVIKELIKKIKKLEEKL